MLKKILSRSLISAPASVLIHQLVALCISLANGDGRYLPVTPAFAARFDNEITSVIVQMLLIGLIGAVFAGCSVIFEIERWSFLKQGLAHLLATSAVLIPISLYCWTPENIYGALALIISWLATYSATWLAQYLVYRHEIRKLNAKIHSVNQEEEV